MMTAEINRDAKRYWLIWAGLVFVLMLGCSAGDHRTAQIRSPYLGDPTYPDSKNITAAYYPLGANLSGVVEYSYTNEFADMMKQTRAFTTISDPNTAPPLDANGWPTADFATYAFVGGGTAGVHKLSFTGSANITLGSSTAQLLNQQYDPKTNITTADVNITDASGLLAFNFSNTNGQVKNIKLIRPGYTNETFTRPFLDHLKYFSLLRTMTWTHANFNDVANWSDRPHVNDATYNTTKGVPWEVIIQLANTLGRDLWINVPYHATDDYVVQLATLFRDTLNPNLIVYIEYSNELWNCGFPECGMNKAQALAEVAAGNSPLNFDGTTDPFVLAMRRHGKRMKEISELFQQVYGPGTFGTRIRPVLAGQMAVVDTLREPLKLIENAYGSPSKYLYALAGAPYFSVTGEGDNTNWSVDQVLSGLSTAVDNLPTTYHFEEHAALARWYGLQFLAYEGGPDTFGPNNVAAKRAASYDSRMKDLCVRYLTVWYQAGFGSFQWFASGAASWNTPYGTWTLTESMDDQNTPKIQAMAAILQMPLPSPTLGHAAPGVISPVQNVGSNKTAAQIELGNQQFDYLVRVSRSGNYMLRITYAATDAGQPISVSANGASIADLPLPITGRDRDSTGPTDYADSAPIPIPLTAGLNVVRLATAPGTFNSTNISKLTITTQ